MCTFTKQAPEQRRPGDEQMEPGGWRRAGSTSLLGVLEPRYLRVFSTNELLFSKPSSVTYTTSLLILLLGVKKSKCFIEK